MMRSDPIRPIVNGDRDRATGRFLPGNRASAGRARPYAARIIEFRRAVLEAVSPADVKRIVRKLVELAADGDVQAARVLLDRVLGKPAEAVDHVMLMPWPRSPLSRTERRRLIGVEAEADGG